MRSSAILVGTTTFGLRSRHRHLLCRCAVRRSRDETPVDTWRHRGGLAI